MAKKKEELKSNYNVPNLERALMIIELLSSKPKGLSLAEIMDELDIAKSSAFRITSTLIFRNYLQKNETTKKLTLTRKILSLGISSLSEQSIVENSIDAMRALRDETKESVMLGILLGDKGTILEQVPSSYPVKLFVEQGTQFSLHSSVGGKSILAYMEEDERNRILENVKLEKFTENTIVSKKDYIKSLKEVKAKGYAIDHSEDIQGINCVGAPIFDESGSPVAAIWITGPDGRLPSSEFGNKGEIVKKYAMEISKKLGYLKQGDL
ncbi:IclR family transcriptional regulator [Pseudozobellia thermophila]|uniref:Transcriptional regulator, IclR family n=1 Tax=Pseudozobellia thermophila TaxID=192903 RepID=A0A1M6GGJ3_9FLAO|nr:IclR family transcriptional regulator [Pseudozobellia thermophila]SHJ09018.1 transcriptional regulator, IclR family [Pseudozobellia thermophila]